MQSLIERIHRAGRRGVLAVTGGGSLAIGDLLTTPGASRSILAASVPYSWTALSDFAGGKLDQACAPETARAMAMSAFQQACAILRRESDDGDVIGQAWGVACTASLKSDRPKKGPHRLHVALQTAEATETMSLYLQKDARSRGEEERLAADIVLTAVATACQVPLPSTLKLLPSESLERTRTMATEDWRDLVCGLVDAVLALGEAMDEDAAGHSARAIFPGAFHPVHRGHRRMAEIAAQRLGSPVEFEISIENVDKPTLDYTEIAARLAQFEEQESVWLTRAATFLEKAAIFPQTTFVVGADTILRIADPQYYESDEACRAAWQYIADRGCRFLVFARLMQGDCQGLKALGLPDELRELCDEVAADDFREDISSTAIRAQQAEPDSGREGLE